MNCCDDNGKCTCSNGGETPRRSCDELAVCQDRTPPCASCTPKTPLRLAPGVIDFGHPTWGEYVSQERRRELLRWLKGGLMFLAVAVLGALAVGLIVGKLP